MVFQETVPKEMCSMKVDLLKVNETLEYELEIIKVMRYNCYSHFWIIVMLMIILTMAHSAVQHWCH
jgi:DNA polymerase III alpha subunit